MMKVLILRYNSAIAHAELSAHTFFTRPFSQRETEPPAKWTALLKSLWLLWLTNINKCWSLDEHLKSIQSH